MNSLIIFVAVAVCTVAALPVFEELQENDELFRHRRSLPAIELEDIPLFHGNELLREPRSLSEGEFEEVPLEAIEEHGTRHKRATCDALSFSTPWLTINHAVCAIHCIVMGYKGGKCVNTICNCSD